MSVTHQSDSCDTRATRSTLDCPLIVDIDSLGAIWHLAAEPGCQHLSHPPAEHLHQLLPLATRLLADLRLKMILFRDFCFSFFRNGYLTNQPHKL